MKQQPKILVTKASENTEEFDSLMRKMQTGI